MPIERRKRITTAIWLTKWPLTILKAGEVSRGRRVSCAPQKRHQDPPSAPRPLTSHTNCHQSILTSKAPFKRFKIKVLMLICSFFTTITSAVFAGQGGPVCPQCSWWWDVEVSEAVHGLGASPTEASAWRRPASPQAPGGEEPPQGEGALRLRGRRRGRDHYQGGRGLWADPRTWVARTSKYFVTFLFRRDWMVDGEN